MFKKRASGISKLTKSDWFFTSSWSPPHGRDIDLPESPLTLDVGSDPDGGSADVAAAAADGTRSAERTGANLDGGRG